MESNDQVAEATSPDSKTNLADEEVVKRARSAANSAKFERLWRGDTGDYDSHSEADMALCCLLAFWTSGDTSQMDRLFRRSGLHREKWDADGSTYGEMTIDRATNVTTESFSPSDDDASTSTDMAESDGDDGSGLPAPESTAAVTNGGTAPLHERERERIETITELEGGFENWNSKTNGYATTVAENEQNVRNSKERQ